MTGLCRRRPSCAATAAWVVQCAMFFAAPAFAQINGVNDNIVSANLNNSGFYTLPTITGLGGDLTVEGWVFLSSYATWAAIADLGNGEANNNILLGTSGTTGRPVFSVRSGGTDIGLLAGSTPLGTNTWAHVAGVIQSDRTMRLYVNGTQVATGTATGDVPVVNRTSNFLGKSNWAADSLLNGSVADVRVWNTARTQTEIQNNMNVGSITGPTTGLVAAYAFGATGAAPTTDLSGNGYTATQNGNILYSKFDTGTLTGGTIAVNNDGHVQIGASGNGTMNQSGGSFTRNTAALGDRGVEFDGIDVGGNLSFNGPTTLTLAFNGSGSLVNWNDDFWSTDKAGTSGWLIYDTAGTTANLLNITITGADWLDAAGNSLLAIHPNASFGLGSVMAAFLAGRRRRSATCALAACVAAGMLLAVTPAFAQITVGGNGVNTVDSTNYSGNQSLTKIGSNTVTLTGNNSYTGETFINAGTLAAATNSALGTGGFLANTKTTVSSGATLGLQGNISLDEHMHISGIGAGGLGAILNLSGSNALTNNIALRNHATLGATAGQVTIAGAIYQDGGVFGVTKAGSGTVVLAGANSYGSETVISTGMLVAANSSALGTGGFSATTKTTVYDGATLALQGNISVDEHMHIFGAGVGGLGAIRNLSGSNSLTSSGYALRSNATIGADAGQLTIARIYEDGGSFGLTKVGAGTLVLSGSSGYTGNTQISGGTLATTAQNALPTATGLTVDNGSTLRLGANQQVASIAGSGAIDLGSSVLTAGGGSFTGTITGSGGLTKSGAGAWTLSGANSFSGSVSVTGGALEFTTIANGSASSLGTGAGSSPNGRIVLNGGTLRFTGTAAQTVNRNIAWGAGTSSVLEASGASGAALVIADAAGDPLFLPGSRTFTFGGTNTDSNTYTGSLNENGGTSSLAKNGTGRWVLSGSSSYTGESFVNAGTLVVTNNAALGAGGFSSTTKTTVADGATLALQGNLSIDEHLHISGTGVGGQGAIANLSGSTTLTNGIALRNHAAIGVAPGLLTMGGSVYQDGGVFGLTKVGAGTLVLTGSNNYGSETVISTGMLVAANSSALGTGGFMNTTKTTVYSGATLGLQGNISSGEHAHIFGDGIGGMGAIRNLSGNNALTSSGYALRSNATVGVDAGSLSMTSFYEEGGSFGLTKTGTGTLTLSAASSYTGNTTVNAGTLVLSGSNRLAPATSATVNAGGTLRLDGNQTLASIGGSGAIAFGTSITGFTLTTGSVSGTFAGSISGAGRLTKVGPGTLTLTGSHSYTAGTLVSAGTLATVGSNVLPTSDNIAVNAGGTLLLGGDQTVGSAGGSGVYNLNGYTLTMTGAAAAFSGDATGGGVLAKSGGGTWRIFGTTSGSTAVVLNGGSIQLMSAIRLSDSGAVTVNGGTLDMNGFTDVAGSVTVNGGKIINGTLTAVGVAMDNGTVSGVLTGSGGFTKTGSGLVTISSSNSYTGLTAISGGTLETTGANRLSAASTMNVSAGGTFKMGGDQTLASVAGSGGINLGNGTLTTGSQSSTFAGSITGNGGLTKIGPGTLTLTGSNSFTGDTNLTGGTLVLASGGALPTDAIVTMQSGATLQLSGTTVVGAIENNGGTVTGGTLVASLVATQSGALDSVIADGEVNGTPFAAGILKRSAGTTTIGAANTFTGAIRLQGGTLQLTGSGGFDPASRLVMSSGATMDLNGKSQAFSAVTGTGGTVALGSGQLTVNNAAGGVFAGVITGSGGLVKTGLGVLELTGASTYTGPTVIDAGELKLNGSLASSSLALAAGATLSGTGTIGGDATIAGTHNPGNSPGVQSIGGDLTYSGSSSVTWELTDNTAALGDRGLEFDGIDVGGNLSFSGPTTLTLAFNGSGSLVNWNDDFWSTDKAGTSGWLIYDTAGTTVNLLNLSIAGTDWLDAAGNSLLAIRPNASFGLEQVGSDVFLTFVAVPEPSTFVLVGIGLAGLSIARRRVLRHARWALRPAGDLDRHRGGVHAFGR